MSITISPSPVPASGAEVTITVRVRGASYCTFVGAGEQTVGCSSGRFAVQRYLSPQTHSYPRLTPFYIILTNGSRQTRSRWEGIEQLGTSGRFALGAPPVKGLDGCLPGPSCDYGAAYEAFPTWGNVAPATLGDCTFAAAADWEQIVLGWQANESAIGYEFARAGGSAEVGLAQSALWAYWQSSGIAGVYLNSLEPYPTLPEAVERGVRTWGAMIAEISLLPTVGLGPYVATAGLHDVVIDGFTPAGPLVATWGQTLQATWEQWRRQAVAVWAIRAGFNG